MSKPRPDAGADVALAKLMRVAHGGLPSRSVVRVRTVTAAAGAAMALWVPAVVAQARTGAQEDTLAQGRRLFTTEVQPSCTVCHALKDAGSTAEVGPPLDELKPDAGRVARALRNGIGVMPSFREKLSEAQIEALARYVAQATGAGR